MTIFTSRTPESYDPYPYRNTADGSRWPDNGGDPILLPHDPRPEFEPTRDPEPWATHGENNSWRSTTEEAHRILGDPAFYHPRFHTEWAPRDRNRNRILIELRALGANLAGLTDTTVAYTIAAMQMYVEATPAEVEHARKVLTRLANVYGVD